MEGILSSITNKTGWQADYEPGGKYMEGNETKVEPLLPEYIFWYVTVVNFVLFVVGVTGNILVLLVIILRHDMRTNMNYLLGSLCVADLLVLLICQSTGMVEFYSKDVWNLGGIMCHLVPLFENASLNSSVMTLWLISCERYQAICRSLKRNQCQLSQRPGRCITFIWLFSIALCTPYCFMTNLEEVEYYDMSIVTVCRTHMQETWHYAYVTSMTVLFFGIPFVVLIFVYSAIVRKIFLTQTPDKNPTSRQRKQAIVMIICVVSLFFVSLLPIRTWSLWVIYTSVTAKTNLGFTAYTNLQSVSRILMYINSAGNPLIYGLVSSRFRNAFKKTVFSCCEKSNHNDFGGASLAPISAASKANTKIYRFDNNHSTNTLSETKVENTAI